MARLSVTGWHRVFFSLVAAFTAAEIALAEGPCLIGPIASSTTHSLESTETEDVHCPCGSFEFVRNDDRSYEGAMMWPGGIGAVAEPFVTPGNLPGSVCFIFAWMFGATSEPTTVDFLIWADDEGEPGEVLGIVAAYDTGTLDPWPLGEQRTVDFDVESSIVPVEGKFWAGMRQSSAFTECPLLLGIDSSSPNGGAMTYVPPGDERSEGWHSIESIYGRAGSFGLSVMIGDCVNPTIHTTWGEIKTLY